MNPSPVASLALENDRGDRVVVHGGRIAAPSQRPGLTVQLGSGELRPGLINAHDHLYLNHYPPLGAPPYRNMYEWGADVHSRFAADVARCSTLPREDAFLFGALKSLLGGATTVVHHDRWSPFLDHGFPVRVGRVRVVHSLGFESNVQEAARGDAMTRELPICMHLAEGVDAASAAEVHTADRLGLLSSELLAVHLVGVGAPEIELLTARQVAMVWCPTSNVRLYGAHAPRALVASGIDVLLGTDSLLSGAGTLLDELRGAQELGYLDEDRLTDAVGGVAARRLGLPEPRLEPGACADLVLLRRPLLQARPRDVALVLVDGVPRIGDADFTDLFERCGVAVEHLDVGGVPKVVIAPLASVTRRVLSLAPECGRILA